MIRSLMLTDHVRILFDRVIQTFRPFRPRVITL